jgi:hypothetical protein
MQGPKSEAGKKGGKVLPEGVVTNGAEDTTNMRDIDAAEGPVPILLKIRLRVRYADTLNMRCVF